VAPDVRRRLAAAVVARYGARVPPEQAETTETLKWAYEELRRIERHWTEQIQNQQRRVAAVLAVNGFLLAFLAAAGLQFTASAQTGWFRIPLDICVILLALGLVFGVLALVPRIPIAGPHPAAAHRADPGPVPDLLGLEPTVSQEPPAKNLGKWLEDELVPHADTRINKGETLKDAWLDSRVVWSAVLRCLPDPAALTGLDQVLPVYPDVEQALAATGV